MDLYIIRHAWAGHFGDPEWPSDFERPLSDEGKARFARVVGQLADRGMSVDLVLTSPLVRCYQTAELVAEGVGGCPQVVPRDELVPGSDLAGLLEWVHRKMPDCERMAWVGHAPDVGRMAAELIGEEGGWIRFAKGATAAIRFNDVPARSEGELRWFATAKLLGV